MAELVLLSAFGVGLAWLLRDGVLEAPSRTACADNALARMQIPEDLWAAFHAVGALAAGETGYVSLASLVIDPHGSVWLDAAAVVHPAAGVGRLAIRRLADGYELQDPRDVGPVEVADPPRTGIRVDTLFH